MKSNTFLVVNVCAALVMSWIIMALMLVFPENLDTTVFALMAFMQIPLVGTLYMVQRN